MQTEANAGFRLSPHQEQLWIEQQDDGVVRLTTAVLYITATKGPLDAAALRGALSDIARRHEILRTTFRRQAGLKVPFQVIHEALALEFVEVDLSAARDGASEPRAPLRAGGRSRLDEAARRPFDLERGPLFRATWVTLAPGSYALGLALPTLVADATALANLIRELCLLLSGSGADLDAEPLQYADFSAWANEVLAGSDEDAAAGKAFWKEQMARPSPALPLGLRGLRGEAGAPGKVALSIKRADLSVVAAAARVHAGEGFGEGEFAAEALGLFTLFLVMLARMSGEPEVSMGYLIDGRAQDEAKGALGLYARLAPVSVSLDPSPRLGELFAKVSAAVREATAWKDYLPTAAPACRVIFEPIELGPLHGNFGAVELLLDGLDAHPSRFGVKLRAETVDGALTSALFFDPALYRAEEAARLARCFERLVASAARDPEAEVRTLAMLPEEDRQSFAAWNQTAAEYPKDQTLHALFEAQVQKTPGRPALVFEGRTLTYEELDAESLRLTRLLRRRGVKAGARVGLCLERGAEMVVALLGILRAGAAYVPLLPDHPKARLAHELEQVSAPALVTLERHLVELPPFAGEILCLDRDRALLDAEPGEAQEPLPELDPEGLAYVIYTSGSTGTPKGVGVSHRNLVNYTNALALRLGLDRDEAREGLHFATVSTIAADLGNTCIFPALVSGGCLHVIGHETAMSAERFSASLAARPIDVLKITPSHLSALLAAATDEGRVLPRRFLLTGGEALTWDLCDRVRHAGACVHLNHYGPTETTIGSLTYGPILADDPARRFAETVPIGRPIANTAVFILDAEGAPVPVGVPGELFIGGAGVSQGYIGQPEQTAARFVRALHVEGPDARLYRTGDRARFLPDGSVEFLGRVDHQVKIRGFRVELGEIESALRKVSGLRAALVVARGISAGDDTPGDARLVAYVVLAARPSPTDAELREALARELPAYMIPAAFVRLDALPLTPNGKVDRRALPAPEDVRSASAAFVAPRTDTEVRLAAIWADVLRIERIGLLETFFELGGHSLLATQVISRVQRDFSVQLDLRTFFDGPTVGALAHAIESAIQGSGAVQGGGAGLATGGAIDATSLLLADIESMSEEEAQRLLDGEE
jgi:amino acid adenylation domain-containing protein